MNLLLQGLRRLTHPLRSAVTSGSGQTPSFTSPPSAIRHSPLAIRHSSPAIPPPRRSTGFTLMELLVVIAIIMIVSSILIASYFAMTRGSSYTAAEKNVFNALTLARQRACIDGKRVYLLFQNSTDLVIVRSAGKVTSTDYPIGKIFDAYADLSTDISNVKIYNMDARGEATVDSISLDNVQVPNAFDPPPTYTAKQLCFHISSVSPANCFEVGDRYGLAVYQMQQLPKGFYCKVDTESLSSQEPDPLQDNNKVIFEPDGRRGDRSIIKITVIEKIVEGTASGGQNRIVFTISPEGKIKVEPIGT